MKCDNKCHNSVSSRTDEAWDPTDDIFAFYGTTVSTCNFSCCWSAHTSCLLYGSSMSRIKFIPCSFFLSEH